MKLDRKQDLNALYQVCVFRVDQKTKIAALADSSKRWHIVLRCTICGLLGLLFGNNLKSIVQISININLSAGADIKILTKLELNL